MNYPQRPPTPALSIELLEPVDEPVSASSMYLKRWDLAKTDEEREFAIVDYGEAWLSEEEDRRAGRSIAPTVDPEQRASAARLEELERRRFVSELAWLSEDEMADLNSQQRRYGQVVTSLTRRQQLAWRETPYPGPHMAAR